jgi:hypothetical protein
VHLLPFSGEITKTPDFVFPPLEGKQILAFTKYEYNKHSDYRGIQKREALTAARASV